MQHCFPLDKKKKRRASLSVSWAKMDSNHRSRKTADLQSAPFGHSGICPDTFRLICKSVAKVVLFSEKANTICKIL